MGRGIEPVPVPQICVLDFDGDLTDWLVASGRAQPFPGWACFHTTMYAFTVEGMECGIIARTIGGPYAVLVAEQLHVSGVNILLGLTSAGRVRPDLPLPGLVVATSAVRDEGTSYHYLAPGTLVSAPQGLIGRLFTGLQGLGLPVAQGALWTTDAPYRETEESLREHAGNGVLAVEMQAASLFAFAEARHAEVGIVAHITNGIDYTGEAFDKGSEEVGWRIVQAMCRACLDLIDQPQNQPSSAAWAK